MTFLMSFNLQSQEYINTIVKHRIDSVYIFPPVGMIKGFDGRDQFKSDSLNQVFLANMKATVPQCSPFKVQFLSEENALNDSLRNYLIKTVPKFKKIDEDRFSKMPLSGAFNEMIDSLPGRYFGIVFYDGYVQTSLGKLVAKSVGLAVVSTLLTGGMFTVYTIPKESILQNNILLIDKQERRYMFYKSRNMNGSALKRDLVLDNYQKIFDRYRLQRAQLYRR